MKNTYKYLLHYLISFVISFIIIYIFIFLGGWRLFESGEPILYEIAAAIVIGFIFIVIYETEKIHETKTAELEKRIEELEKNSNNAQKESAE